MKNKEIAKRMISGFINSSNMGFENILIELAAIDDDERLLEHINLALDVLTAAKKEIEDEREDNL